MEILKFDTRKFILIFFFVLLVVNSQSLQSNPKYITKSKNYYIVKRGDNLTKISRAKKIPLNKLRMYNNLKSDKIFVGQKIYLKPKNSGKSEFVTQKPIPSKNYHLVKRGDTLYRISKIYGIDVINLVEINELQSFNIKVGQKIYLEETKSKIQNKITKPTQPKRPETVKAKKKYHKVKRGENLTRIAKKYNMTLNDLKKLNNLKKEKIFVGQRLVVKGTAISKTNTVAKKVPIPKINNNFESPLKGKILSRYGMRDGKQHKGIDIGALTGEPISAASDGQVVFSGQQRGYGNVIVVEHKNAIMTVYAHNENNFVRTGDDVKKGQPIATVGQTGNASAPHVHFEYRIKGRAVDPETYVKIIEVK